MVKLSDDRLWTIIIRIVSLILWVILIVCVSRLLQCNRSYEGFTSMAFEPYFANLMELDKKLTEIERFLKDEDRLFNKLEKRDQTQRSEFDKMSSWIINKHKSMIQVKERRDEEERKRVQEEEEKKRIAAQTPKKDTVSPTKTVDIYKDPYFPVESFQLMNSDRDRLIRAASRYYIRMYNTLVIVESLENSIKPLIEWKNYVYSLPRNETKERFLDYDSMLKEDVDRQRSVTEEPASLVEEKPYAENVVARINYNISKNKVSKDMFDKMTTSKSFEISAATRVLTTHKEQLAGLADLEKRVHLYEFNLTEVYELYQQEQEKEKAKVGEAVDTVRDEYKAKMDAIMSAENQGNDTVVDAGANQGALLGTVMGSTNNMKLDSAEKQQAEEDKKKNMDEINKMFLPTD